MPLQQTVNLGEHYAAFIGQQVASGRYASAADAVEAGLKLLEEREAKVAALRALLKEGEESGPAEYSLESFLAELDAQA